MSKTAQNLEILDKQVQEMKKRLSFDIQIDQVNKRMEELMENEIETLNVYQSIINGINSSAVDIKSSEFIEKTGFDLLE